jgi:hypothetical protein
MVIMLPIGVCFPQIRVNLPDKLQLPFGLIHIYDLNCIARMHQHILANLNLGCEANRNPPPDTAEIDLGDRAIQFYYATGNR